MRKSIEIILNIIFWVATWLILSQLFAIENIIEEIDHNGTVERKISYSYEIIWTLGLGIVFRAAFFYSNLLWIAKKFYAAEKRKYILVLVLILVAFLVAEMLTQQLLFPQRNQLDFNIWLRVISNHLFQYFIVSIISIAYFLIIEARKEAQLKEQLEKEKTAAELKALKSQINPHFLFNALNNLLSITNKAGNDEASTAITQLSNMMRFLLHDAGQQRIAIMKEIKFIENYIALNQLRFSEEDDIFIDFKHDVRGFNELIEPALLIPFVENAFKHGIDIFKPSLVIIKLLGTANQDLQFKIENSIHPNSQKNRQEEMIDSGIGLRNVKERLRICYPDQHQLKIKETNNRYSVQLNIQL